MKRSKPRRHGRRGRLYRSLRPVKSTIAMGETLTKMLARQAKTP